MAWEQGQHIALVGSNGSGKTFLESRLLELGRYRSYTIVFRTKSDDVKFPRFRTIRRALQAELVYNYQTGRAVPAGFLLDPPYERQALEGYRVLEKIWQERAWTLAIDELWYATDKLRLGSGIDRLLTQGRSLKISVVVGMQRPSRVSRFSLSECIHLFAFRCEGRDIQTLAEAFTPRLKEMLPTLGRYQFAYFNRITNQLTVGRAQDLGRIFG